MPPACGGHCSSPDSLKSPRSLVMASDRVGGGWRPLLKTSPGFTPCLLWLGPRLPKTQLILAVNWKGLYFLDQREKMLLELSFPEVMSLITNRWVTLGKVPKSLSLQKLSLWGSRRDGERMAHCPWETGQGAG